MKNASFWLVVALVLLVGASWVQAAPPVTNVGLFTRPLGLVFYWLWEPTFQQTSDAKPKANTEKPKDKPKPTVESVLPEGYKIVGKIEYKKGEDKRFFIPNSRYVEQESAFKIASTPEAWNGIKELLGNKHPVIGRVNMEEEIAAAFFGGRRYAKDKGGKMKEILYRARIADVYITSNGQEKKLVVEVYLDYPRSTAKKPEDSFGKSEGAVVVLNRARLDEIGDFQLRDENFLLFVYEEDKK